MSLPSKIILIGASTGGPGQIEKIISSLPILYGTTLIIAQHMAVDFIPSFIQRVQKHSISPLSLAYKGEVLQVGNIYFCSGTTTVAQRNSTLQFNVEPSQENRYNPDINSIFASFVPFAKDTKILAVILTGIGDDGVGGCRELSLAGANTATQNSQSAIVDGMPSRARKDVPNIEVLDIEGIKNKIREFSA